MGKQDKPVTIPVRAIVTIEIDLPYQGEQALTWTVVNDGTLAKALGLKPKHIINVDVLIEP